MSEDSEPQPAERGPARGAAPARPGAHVRALRVHEHPRRAHGLKVQRARLSGRLANERARTVAALFRAIKLLESFEGQTDQTEYLEFKWKFQAMAERLSALDPDEPGDLDRFIRVTQEIKDVSLRLGVVAETLAASPD